MILPLLFDRTLVRQNIIRARRAPADFLLARSVEDLGERLDTIPRGFVSIVDLGTPSDALARALARRWPTADVRRLSPVPNSPVPDGTAALVGDPEHVPFAAGAFDLAVSAFALQSVNDLPGTLVQTRRLLRPDGLFLGVMLGGRSLNELRTVLTEADVAQSGGASPRVAPFADVRDMGGLLQRAGFALPVADSDVVTVRYASLFGLMADLRAMGATNALVERRKRPTGRALFAQAAALYAERFADADGRIRATFEIISLSGWAPHESQQKPAKRGSGTVSLAAVLGDRAADR